MRLILNLIWFVLCGLWMAIGYAFAALICFVLIITIPFGIAALRIGVFTLANFKLIPVSLLPLGRDIVTVEQARAIDAQRIASF